MGFIVCLCAPLLFSVWLHSALSVSFSWYLSLTRLVGLFRHRFFFGYLWFLSLAASSVLLFLSSFPLRFGWSSGRLSGLLCSFGLAPLYFWIGRSFHLSRVFCYLSYGFPWLFHGVFFRAPLLSFLPLGCSCLVGVLGALCLPPLCTFSYFVFFCLQRFFLLYRFPVLFLVLPLSLWFRSCSSPASSYSSVPCRRVLRVCLQFRLRLRRVILIPFPLL